jgi:carbamoyl-phosphate synthase/aspartate carbamoyltransferase
MFSFTRLRGADPTLGVEMASTGEVACFGSDAQGAFLQAMLATGFKIPSKGSTVLLSIANDDFRREFAESASILNKMGYKLSATPGTARWYKANCNLDMKIVAKPVTGEDEANDASDAPNALTELKESDVELVINISEGTTRKDEISSGYMIRRTAVDFGIGLVTNVKCAVWLAKSMELGYDKFKAKSIAEFYHLDV